MEYSKRPNGSKGFITDWHHSEGVFETPQGKFIARVKRRNKRNSWIYETISQHACKEDAQKAFNTFKENQPLD